MKKITLLMTLIFIQLSLAQGTVNTNSPFFDTHFLVQYDKVADLLKAEGFSEGFFKSADKLDINYLYLNRPKARYNIIFCAGWLPGRKEGMSTFYEIMPDDCNILFFDARGHGASQGTLLRNIWSYGLHEYKDIIGAIKYVSNCNNLPTIVYGTCAGAFHATHALINLGQSAIDEHNIAGLIFDSGWASLPKTSLSAPMAKVYGIIAKKIKRMRGLQETDSARSSLLYKLSTYPLHAFAFCAHGLLFRPFFWWNNQQTTLFGKMDKVPVPILFIHSHDDDYVDINDVQKLAHKATNAQSWWIEHSSHACHYLKHTDAYYDWITNFINSVLV